MFARVVGISLALVRARQSKFSRGVKRKNSERGLKRGNRGVILLQLRIEIADKVERVRLGRRDLSDMLKRFDRFFLLANVLVNQPQVVPGVRITRQFFRRFLQGFPGVFGFLLAEERNAQIELRQQVVGL